MDEKEVVSRVMTRVRRGGKGWGQKTNGELHLERL